MFLILEIVCNCFLYPLGNPHQVKMTSNQAAVLCMLVLSLPPPLCTTAMVIMAAITTINSSSDPRRLLMTMTVVIAGGPMVQMALDHSRYRNRPRNHKSIDGRERHRPRLQRQLPPPLLPTSCPMLINICINIHRRLPLHHGSKPTCPGKWLLNSLLMKR